MRSSNSESVGKVSSDTFRFAFDSEALEYSSGDEHELAFSLTIGNMPVEGPGSVLPEASFGGHSSLTTSGVPLLAG